MRRKSPSPELLPTQTEERASPTMLSIPEGAEAGQYREEVKAKTGEEENRTTVNGEVSSNKGRGLRRHISK